MPILIEDETKFKPITNTPKQSSGAILIEDESKFKPLVEAPASSVQQPVAQQAPQLPSYSPYGIPSPATPKHETMRTAGQTVDYTTPLVQKPLQPTPPNVTPQERQRFPVEDVPVLGPIVSKGLEAVYNVVTPQGAVAEKGKERGFIGATAAGAYQGIGRAASLAHRSQGDNATANAILQNVSEYEQSVATGDAGVQGFLAKTYRGALASLITSTAGAVAGGAPGAILFASASEMNSAIHEGQKAGLSGDDLAMYTVRAGLIEATPATVMQALGMGGFEKIIGGLRKSGVPKEAANTATRGIMAALKQLGVSTAQEVPEEIITEIGHNLNTGLSNVDPSLLTAEKMFDTALNTTAQTVMTMGMVNARNIARGTAQSASDAKIKHDIRRAEDILGGLKDKPLQAQLEQAFESDADRKKGIKKVHPIQTQAEVEAGVDPSRFSVDIGMGHTIEVTVTPIEKPTTPEGMARHLNSVRNEHFGDEKMMSVLDDQNVPLQDKFEQAWRQYPATGGWVTLPNGEQTDVAGLIKLANPKPGMVFNHETLHGALRLFTTDKEFETVTQAAQRNGAVDEEGLVNSLLLRGALESGKATDTGVLGILNRANMRMKGFVRKLYGGEKSFDEIARELFEGTITQRDAVADVAARDAQLKAMAGQTPNARAQAAPQGPQTAQAAPQGRTLSDEIAEAQRAEMMGEVQGIPPAGPMVQGAVRPGEAMRQEGAAERVAAMRAEQAQANEAIRRVQQERVAGMDWWQQRYAQLVRSGMDADTANEIIRKEQQVPYDARTKTELDALSDDEYYALIQREAERIQAEERAKGAQSVAPEQAAQAQQGSLPSRPAAAIQDAGRRMNRLNQPPQAGTQDAAAILRGERPAPEEAAQPVTQEVTPARLQSVEGTPVSGGVLTEAMEGVPKRRRFEAVTPRGNVRVSGEFQVVDAGSLITSDMEGYDQTLQVRNRDTLTSRAQIADIAKSPDPTRLMDAPTTDLGAPLVDESGQVISGNGRTMGLREAYATNNAEAYRKAVDARARRYGLSTEGIANPVLVRVMRDTGGATVKQVSDLSNQNQILQMTTAEQAQADADAIGPFVELFQTDEAGNIRAASNRSFLTNFVQATHSDSLLNSDGTFSPEIDNRVKRAMLARVFKNSEAGRAAVQNVFENAESLGIKRVLDGVTQAAGRLVTVSELKPQLDITPSLGKALHEYAVFRQKVADGEVKVLDEYLGQGDMFQERDPVIDTLIQELDIRGRKSATALFSLLDRYGKLAEKIDLDTPDMFTGQVDRTTPQELLDRARQELETESAERANERANARREGRVPGAPRQNAGTGQNVARPENAPAGEGNYTDAQGKVGETEYSTRGNTTFFSTTNYNLLDERRFLLQRNQGDPKKAWSSLESMVLVAASNGDTINRNAIEAMRRALRLPRHYSQNLFGNLDRAERQYQPQESVADDEQGMLFSTLSPEMEAERDLLLKRAGGDTTRAWKIYERMLSAAATRGEPVDPRLADTMRRALLGTGEQADLFGEAAPQKERRTFTRPAERPVQQSLEGLDEGMLFSTLKDAEALVVPATEAGYRGPIAQRSFAVPGYPMSDTKEEAARAYLDHVQQKEELAQEKQTWNDVAPKLLNGTYTDDDVKRVTRFGKTSASRSETMGILEQLGLRPVDANKVLKATPAYDTTREGSVLYDIGQAVETARNKGYFVQQGKQPEQGMLFSTQDWNGREIRTWDPPNKLPMPTGWKDGISVTPQGAKLVDNEMIVADLSVYSDGRVFLQVAPEYRRKGVGRSLWSAFTDKHGPVKIYKDETVSPNVIPLLNEMLKEKRLILVNKNRNIEEAGQYYSTREESDQFIDRALTKKDFNGNIILRDVRKDEVDRVLQQGGTRFSTAKGDAWLGPAAAHLKDDSSKFYPEDTRTFPKPTYRPQDVGKNFRIEKRPAMSPSRPWIVAEQMPSNEWITDKTTGTEDYLGAAERRGMFKTAKEAEQWIADHEGTMRYSTAQTGTPEFKRWFGDSKVVDEDGKPLVVYHGTMDNFTIFSETTGINKHSTSYWGHWFTKSPTVAGKYGLMIKPVYLKISNPYIITDSEFRYKHVERKTSEKSEKRFIRLLKENGHDGIIVVPDIFAENDDDINQYGEFASTRYVAFSPTQIKSATGNTGAFDPDNPDIRYSTVTDPDLLRELNSGETVKAYRAMQLIDGKLYPPMSAKVQGELRQPTELGVWEQSEEQPELAKDGFFTLNKGNKKSIKARYNPYFHVSTSPLNDQFSEAHKRPNLVTVEVAIPASELKSGYKAEGAKDAVGKVQWRSGPVSTKTGRDVFLSRYAKAIRIVPDSEVAEIIAKSLQDKNVPVPAKVITPSLKQELEKQGVPIRYSTAYDNQGNPIPQEQRYDPTNPDIRYSTSNLEGLSKPERDRYLDAAFAAMYQYGADEGAYKEALRAQFGRKIDPYLGELRNAYWNRTAKKALSGEDAEGRRDLANPALEEAGRKAMNVADEALYKTPEPRKDEAVFQEAAALDRGVLREKILGGRALSDAETFAGQEVVTEAFRKAFASNSMEDMQEAVRVANGWRRGGAEVARAMRMRRDRMQSPQERFDSALGLALLKPGVRTQKRMDSIEKQLENTELSDKERERLRGEYDKQIEIMSRENEAIRRKLAAQGVIIDQLRERLAAATTPHEQEQAETEAASVIHDIMAAKRYGPMDALYEFWISSLLSGPKTHVVNTTSNALHTFWELGPQRVMEAFVNSAARKEDAAQWGEFRYMAGAMGPGLKRAFRNMVRSWKLERPTFQEEIGLSQKEAGTIGMAAEHRGGALDQYVGKRVGRTLRIPLRGLMALDEFTKSLAGQMDAAAHAYRQGKAKGLKDKPLQDYIAAQVADLSSQAWDAGLRTALRVSFQTPLSVKGEEITGSIGDSPLRWAMPFRRTPANIFKTGIRKTPLGTASLLKHWKTLSGDDKIRLLSEQMIGWAVGAALFGLLAGDDDDEPWITGSIPYKSTKPGERELKERTMPAQSIRFGDKWYSYARLEPFATMLQSLVDGSIAIQKADKGQAAHKAATDFMSKSVEAAMDKTFMRGLGDLYDAIQEPESMGVTYATNFATGFVPNIVKQTARSADPYYREQRLGKGGDYFDRLEDRIKYKAVPYGKLPPKRTIWGEPLKKSTTGSPTTDFLFRLFSPVDDMTVSGRDPRAVKLDRLITVYNSRHDENTYAPERPDRYITRDGKRIDLTDKEYDRLVSRIGELSLESLSKQRLNYTRPTLKDIEVIRKAREAAGRRARAEIKR